MPDIPGYYYDAARNKYFKIEQSHTAPAQAPWSSDAVKQRELQAAEDQELLRRGQLVKRHVRRSLLQKDIVLGGLVGREVFSGFTPEDGRARRMMGDVEAAAWAGGLREKGQMCFDTIRMPSTVNVPCFWIGGGIAYTVFEGQYLAGEYISPDENEELAPLGRSRHWFPLQREIISCPKPSSIEYHEPSHRLLLTSSDVGFHAGLYSFSPPISEDEQTWVIGDLNSYCVTTWQYVGGHDRQLHRCTPAPASSNLLCILGSNVGIVHVTLHDAFDLHSPRDRKSQNGLWQTHEIFGQDFQMTNHNVILAGGRRPRVWISDIRTPDEDWRYIPHASSVAHVRSINPNHVLVAGLENKMSLYDLRFFSQRPNGRPPLLDFPDYRNAAHFNIGWDVCPEINVVAAAHDDGTVGLFSLQSGRKLGSPTLDTVQTDTPIKALRFHKQPTVRTPNLWVGEGQSMKKFSFGRKSLDDEE